MTRLDIAEDLAQARQSGSPVVLLDAMLLTYGLPYPANTEKALELQAQIAARGVLPVFAAVVSGRIVVGLSPALLHDIGQRRGLAKIGPADIAAASVRKLTGVLTVGALLVVARQCGIPVIGTGGLGGVHRGLPDVVDISSDIAELSRSAVAVVCSGAKAILDLPNTVELLETLGIPVLGVEVDSLPGYWTRETGLPVTARVDTAVDIAAICRAQRELQLQQGLLVANPVAAGMSLDAKALEGWIMEAQAEAREHGIRGKALTPFLQKRLQEMSGGETVARTLQLLTDNCLLAAEVALAMARPSP